MTRPKKGFEWRYFGTPYPISNQQYQIIKNENFGDKFFEIARMIYAPTLYQGIVLLIKYAIKIVNKVDYIMGYEVTVFCTTLILSLLVIILRCIMRTPKKELMKDMCRHFKENKERFGVFKSDD